MEAPPVTEHAPAQAAHAKAPPSVAVDAPLDSSSFAPQVADCAFGAIAWRVNSDDAAKKPAELLGR